MAFEVKKLIADDNLTITDNGDGTFSIDYDIESPQANTYTFYWKWTMDTATNFKIMVFFQDYNSGEWFPRYVKDLVDGEFIIDECSFTWDATKPITGSFSDIVMRNEKNIRILLTPDDVAGNDEFEVMIRTNTLLGKGNR